MKHFIAILLIAFTALSSAADEFRKWTDAETGRQIEGKIVDKKLDDSEAKLLLRNGRNTWVKAERLTEVDQEYIRVWSKAVDHLTTKVTAMGKGWKELTITAVAGSEDLTVKAFWFSEEGKRRKGYPKVFEIPKGEEREITVRVGKNYKIEAWQNATLVETKR